MANEWIIKDYDGAAVATTLAGAISGATTSITLTDGSGLPDGAQGPFVLVINKGEADEEKILVASRAANVLTVTERGYDGTAAAVHADLDPVEHCLDAHSMKQANALAAIMDSTGSMAYRGAGMSYVELAVPGDGYFLVTAGGVPVYISAAAASAALSALIADAVDGSGLGYSGGALVVNVDGTSIEISADTLQVKAGGITAAHIATGAVGSDEIAADAVGSSEIAAGAVGTTELANDAVTADKIAADAVGASEIAAGAVGTDELAAAAVTGTKVANDTLTTANLAPGEFADIELIKRDTYMGRAYISVSQPITSGVAEIVIGDVEDYDYQAMHNTANGHVTCPENGVVGMGANLSWEVGNATGYRQVEIRHYNGGGTLLGIVAAHSQSAGDGASDYPQLSCYGEIEVSAGDILRVHAQQNSGSELDVYAAIGTQSSYFWSYKRFT